MIHMQYLLGDESVLREMPKLFAREPFASEVVEFCKVVSKELLRTPLGRGYPDIITLGFWLRKSSLENLKKQFVTKDERKIYLGRGIIFHVAPSNVPVNFAYSLFAGLLCGNANVVRVPSKGFEQVTFIIGVLKKVIEQYPEIKPYICLVKYGHEQEVNDDISSFCDVRVIWGGDNTITEIRKSPLSMRATEICFADRFSLAVIDISVYKGLNETEKGRIARAFYNDTYLTDQNACTSPKLVIWIYTQEEKSIIAEIRKEFWVRLWGIVEKEYVFQDIQGVDKLTKRYLIAADEDIILGEKPGGEDGDNRLVRVEITNLIDKLPNYFGHSGYFLEYTTTDIMDLARLGMDNRCQTIGYLGQHERILPLLKMGLKGIDRVVPIGKTMDFDFIWDGYNLYERFTRIVTIDVGLN